MTCPWANLGGAKQGFRPRLGPRPLPALSQGYRQHLHHFFFLSNGDNELLLGPYLDSAKRRRLQRPLAVIYQSGQASGP